MLRRLVELHRRKEGRVYLEEKKMAILYPLVEDSGSQQLDSAIDLRGSFCGSSTLGSSSEITFTAPESEMVLPSMERVEGLGTISNPEDDRRSEDSVTPTLPVIVVTTDGNSPPSSPHDTSFSFETDLRSTKAVLEIERELERNQLPNSSFQDLTDASLESLDVLIRQVDSTRRDSRASNCQSYPPPRTRRSFLFSIFDFTSRKFHRRSTSILR